jgi:hypothetical protein
MATGVGWCVRCWGETPGWGSRLSGRFQPTSYAFPGTAPSVGTGSSRERCAVLFGCTAVERHNQPNEGVQATANSVRSCRAPASGGADAARRQAAGVASCLAFPPCHQRRISGRVTPLHRLPRHRRIASAASCHRRSRHQDAPYTMTCCPTARCTSQESGRKTASSRRHRLGVLDMDATRLGRCTPAAACRTEYTRSRWAAASSCPSVCLRVTHHEASLSMPYAFWRSVYFLVIL